MTLDYQQLSWVWYINDNLHGYMHYLLLVKRLGLNYAVRGLGRSNAAAEVLIDGPAAGAVEALVDVKIG